MFKLKGEKKKEKEEDAFRFKQFYSDIIKDALPTTIGTSGTAASVYGLNWLAWLVEHPKMSFSDWQKKKKEWIYNYHRDAVDLGLYTVGLTAIQNTIKNAEISLDVARNKPINVTTDYGDAHVKLNNHQKKFMLYNNVFDMLSTMGFMDADLYNLIQKIDREQIKKGIQKGK
jgi:hypothetical protein